MKCSLLVIFVLISTTLDLSSQNQIERSVYLSGQLKDSSGSMTKFSKFKNEKEVNILIEQIQSWCHAAFLAKEDSKKVFKDCEYKDIEEGNGGVTNIILEVTLSLDKVTPDECPSVKMTELVSQVARNSKTDRYHLTWDNLATYEDSDCKVFDITVRGKVVSHSDAQEKLPKNGEDQLKLFKTILPDWAKAAIGDPRVESIELSSMSDGIAVLKMVLIKKQMIPPTKSNCLTSVAINYIRNCLQDTRSKGYNMENVEFVEELMS